NPVIKLESVEWAKAIVGYCVETMITEAGRNVPDNEMEAQTKKVLSIIRRAGAAGIARYALTRATWFLGGDRRREEVLSELVNADRIIQSVVAPGRFGGRPETRFKAKPRSARGNSP